MIIDDVDLIGATSSLPGNLVYYLVPHGTNIAFAASNWCVVTMSSLRYVCDARN